MHSLFFSTILSLNRLTSFPDRSLSNAPIPRNNEAYLLDGCSRDDALKQIINGSTCFHHDMIEKAAYNLTTSFLISPILISTAMYLLRHGNVSKDQSMLYSRLHIPENQCVEKVGMQALIDDLAGYKPSGLSMARSVFASPRMQLRPEFVEVATKGFRSSIQRIDFDDTNEREKFIRAWCLDKNDGRALNFSDSCAPDAGMSLAFINALRLDVKWLHEFQVKDTSMGSFNDSKEGAEPLVMMKTTGYFRHGSFPETNATFVELPFKTTSEAHNMSMFLIRPGNTDTVAFLESIKDLKMEKMIAQGSYNTTTVEVPRFTIQSQVNIRMLLLENGLWTSSFEDIFETQFNDYAGFDETVRLRFSKYTQKSVIDVSEGGVRAVTMDGMSVPNITAPAESSYNFYFIIGTTGKDPVSLLAGRLSG